MRHYLYPEEGPPLRMSQRLIEGLIFGEDALPALANTKQKILGLILRNEDGEPQEIVYTEASIWQFNEEGKADRSLRDGALEYLNLAGKKFDRAGGNVVDLHPDRKRKQLDEIHRWEPSAAQIQAAIDDIWPKKGKARLKDLKGIAPKRPPLTYEAKHALSEISRDFWKIDLELGKLKEPGLKGLAFEARERAAQDLASAPLYRAVAEIAERQNEIERRKRTGRGIWYAVVEATHHDDDDTGHIEIVAHEKHQGRLDAVAAARRLLAESASRFSERTTIEARLMTDIEWEIEGR